MSEAIDQVWLRLCVGRAAKPTARELGLCTDTVREDLLRCGGIRPEPRRRAAARLRLEERQEISRCAGATPVRLARLHGHAAARAFVRRVT